MTTATQEMAHKNAVISAEAAKQVAQAAAWKAYNNTPAAYPAFAAAMKAADAAYVRALIASSAANGMEGSPKQTLREIAGSWD